MNFKEWLKARVLFWTLSDALVHNMESAWNAAIDEAVKVANDNWIAATQNPVTPQKWMNCYSREIAEAIKELKQ